jgi:hypothetical protein
MKKILEQMIIVYRGLESQFRRPRIYVLVFFLLYLVIGLSIYKDYGISWNEPTQRRSAIVTAHDLTSIFLPSYNPPEYISVPPLRAYVDNKYGVFFDLLMYIGDVVLDYQGNVLFQVMSSIKKPSVFTSPRIAISIVACLFIVSLTVTSLQMIRYHPHQYAYFNFLAGKSVGQKFDLDYWGLSYRDGLEYIVNNDLRPVIKLAANSIVPMKNNK